MWMGVGFSRFLGGTLKVYWASWPKTVAERARTGSQGCFRIHSWGWDLQAYFWGHGWTIHLLGSWVGKTTPWPQLREAWDLLTGSFQDQKLNQDWNCFQSQAWASLSPCGSLGSQDCSWTIAASGWNSLTVSIQHLHWTKLGRLTFQGSEGHVF